MEFGINTPMTYGGIWNVDTGGGAVGGKVTIMDVSTKEYWQSDLTKELYPTYIFVI
jgi:serine/threonine protein phosphatase 1